MWGTLLSVEDFTKASWDGSHKNERKASHFHTDLQGLNPNIFAGTLLPWFKNYWKSTFFQRDLSLNFTAWCLSVWSYEMQFPFIQELRSARSSSYASSFSISFTCFSMASIQLSGQLKEKLGYGLGLNSMQGREAKHVKLARYVQNTYNVKKSSRWWTVFRHEFVSMVWLWGRDPYSITYHIVRIRIQVIRTSQNDWKTTSSAIVVGQN